MVRALLPFWGVALVLACIGCVPLLIYCILQERRGWLLLVAALSLVGGVAVATWPSVQLVQHVESTGAMAVLPLLLAVGGVVCAYGSVAATKWLTRRNQEPG